MTKDEVPASSRIDTSEPFHAELKAAFDGVSKATAAVQKITGSPDFPGALTHQYGHMIVTTLKIEIDSLSAMATSAWQDVEDARGNR